MEFSTFKSISFSLSILFNSRTLSHSMSDRASNGTLSEEGFRTEWHALHLSDQQLEHFCHYLKAMYGIKPISIINWNIHVTAMGEQNALIRLISY